MNKFKALTKLMLTDYFSRYRNQMNAKSRGLSFIIFLLPLIIALPFFSLIGNLYDQFSAIGQGELTLTYVYVAAVVLMLISAMPVVIAVYFFAKDLGLLTSLPLSRRIIISSKMTLIYIPLLVIALLSMGPAVWFIGTAQGFKLMTLLLGLVAILLGPIAPMAMAMILVMPLMSLVSGHKNRKRLIYIGNFSLIIFIIGFQLAMARLQTQNLDVLALLTDPNGFLYFIGQRFYPSIWLTRMVMGSMVDAALVMGTYGLMTLLALVISDRMLAKSLTAYNQASASTGGPASHSTQSHSPMYWLVKRHLGVIVHNPTFLLQISMTLFLPVLMLVILSLTGELNLDMLKGPQVAPYHLLIVTGVMIAPSLMGTLSATAITREGKTFWETVIMPIPTRVNLASRMLTSDLLNVGSGTLMGMVLSLLLGLPLLHFLLALVLAISFSRFWSMVDLFINIKRPYLTWTSPTAAIKNNLNIMIALVLRLILAGLAYLVFMVFNLSQPVTMVLLALVFINLLNTVILFFVYPKFIMAFNQIEV